MFEIDTTHRGLWRFSLGVLLTTVLVIVWGAFVRVTGSGAGCGSHWPLCNGAVVPASDSVHTLIEYIHRVTSGLVFMLTAVLYVKVRKRFPKRHPTRNAAALSMLLMIIEALVGAMLVLLGLVAKDASALRAIVIALHLINSLLLLAAMTCTSLLIAAPDTRLAPNARTSLLLHGPAWIAVLITGATGAIAALGNTLFPAASLLEGIAMDLDPAAHFLLRLRVLHPVFAVGTVVYLILLGIKEGTNLGYAVILVALMQVALGFINLLLLAPIGLQLLHLLVADVLWILLVSFSFQQLVTEPRTLIETS